MFKTEFEWHFYIYKIQRNKKFHVPWGWEEDSRTEKGD